MKRLYTHLLPPVAVALTAVVQLLPVARCLGAWISEVQPWPRTVINHTGTATFVIPPLIEISGLHGLPQAELVIIDASPSPLSPGTPAPIGTVLRVVPLIGEQDIRVAAESPWPQQMGSPNPGSAVVLPPGQTLGLGGKPRTLLLFDGPTGLVSFGDSIQSWPDLANATLLDALTLGPANAAAPLGNEPSLGIATDQALSRPMQSTANPWDSVYLIGRPSLDGTLDNTESYRLDPGLANLVIQTLPSSQAETPEPSTATATVLLVSLFWIIRKRTIIHP